MADVIETAVGYKATRTDAELIIHDVEIFCENEHPKLVAGKKWLKAAFKKAQAEALEGYYPPLHVKHHEKDTEVKSGGWFEMTAIEPITLGGERRQAIIADYHVTDDDVADEILAGKLRYRSVEIFDVEDSPSIDGLALLDHEAPFLRFPMLMVTKLNDRSSLIRSSSEKVWAHTICKAAQFKAGHCVNPLKREESDMSEKKGPETFGEGITAKVDVDASVQFEGDKPPIPPAAEESTEEGENKGPANIDAASVIGAINDGSIPIGDFDSICEAIDARRAAATQPQPQQPNQPQQPQAQIPPPGGATMKAEPGSMNAQYAAQEGKIAGLEAREKERDVRDTARDKSAACKTDVAIAMKRLDTVPCGDLEALEKRLTAFREKCEGDDATELFTAYVDALAQHAPAPEKETSTAFHAGAEQPEFMAKYLAGSPGDVDRAAQFAQQWNHFRDRGIRVSQERYVEINMRTAQEA